MFVCSLWLQDTRTLLPFPQAPHVPLCVSISPTQQLDVTPSSACRSKTGPSQHILLRGIGMPLFDSQSLEDLLATGCQRLECRVGLVVAESIHDLTHVFTQIVDLWVLVDGGCGYVNELLG